MINQLTNVVPLQIAIDINFTSYVIFSILIFTNGFLNLIIPFIMAWK